MCTIQVKFREIFMESSQYNLANISPLICTNIHNVVLIFGKWAFFFLFFNSKNPNPSHNLTIFEFL